MKNEFVDSSVLKSFLKMKCVCFSFQFICIVVPHRLWSGQEIQRQQDTTAHTVQRRQKSHRHSSLCQYQRTLGHRAEVSTPAQTMFSFCSLCSNQLSLQSLCSNQAISSLKSFTITSSVINPWSWHFVVLSDWWTVLTCPLPNEWHVSGQRINLGMVYTIPPAHVLYTTFAF